MELAQEIQAAARHLGQCVRQDKLVQEYLEALEASQTDPQASALEKKMYDEYKKLIAREQIGEILTQEDTRSFYELRQQVQAHPLITRRNDMHRLIRPYLSAIAEEINFPLGVDFAALAKPH
jgi:cell fate (sporulation/competence/biofilm development) regulator YlbF (YheA/YmcA/DUF963 family)